MIFVDCSVEEWTKSKKVYPVDYSCPGCGQSFKTTIPFVTTSSYGLMSPAHDCKNHERGMTFVPRDSRTVDNLTTLCGSFSF